MPWALGSSYDLGQHFLLGLWGGSLCCVNGHEFLRSGCEFLKSFCSYWVMAGCSWCTTVLETVNHLCFSSFVLSDPCVSTLQSVPYHGSWHETETLGFSLNNRLGIREGPSQCPTPKPALYIYKYIHNMCIYKRIFSTFMLRNTFGFLDDSYWVVIFPTVSSQTSRVPWIFLKMSVFLQR